MSLYIVSTSLYICSQCHFKHYPYSNLPCKGLHIHFFTVSVDWLIHYSAFSIFLKENMYEL